MGPEDEPESNAVSSVTWDDLAAHTVPDWFHDAKLGIFVHWGLYSVPAWASRTANIRRILARQGPRGMFRANPYAEWYANSSQLPGTEAFKHHRDVWGGRPYDDFRAEFDDRSSAADLDSLAAVAHTAGARYLVLTAKHHDGYLLWPSALSHPRKGAYHARRDLVGDLADAVRERGMKFGVYYSGGYDWAFNDAVMRRAADSFLAGPVGQPYAGYAEAHLRELVDRYAPSVLWNDIGWPGGGDLPGTIDYFYRSVPDGVINDRWATGSAERSRSDERRIRIIGRAAELVWPLIQHLTGKAVAPTSPRGDFETPEYESFDEIRERKWEQARGVGHSFALNRNEPPEDLIAVPDLVREFVDVVSKNGNLLLGVGPDASGEIPAEQRAVVEGLGAWLAVNGDAIYGTRPWRRAEGETRDGTSVRFTRGTDAVYAITLAQPPAREVVFDLRADDALRVELLGADALETAAVDGRVAVTLPASLPPAPAQSPALAFRITGAEPADAEARS